MILQLKIKQNNPNRVDLFYLFHTIGKSYFPIVEKSLRSNGCTQFYLRKIGAEQIYGKPTMKDKISTKFKAFRFVLAFPIVLIQIIMLIVYQIAHHYFFLLLRFLLNLHFVFLYFPHLYF